MSYSVTVPPSSVEDFPAAARRAADDHLQTTPRSTPEEASAVRDHLIRAIDGTVDIVQRHVFGNAQVMATISGHAETEHGAGEWLTIQLRSEPT